MYFIPELVFGSFPNKHATNLYKHVQIIISVTQNTSRNILPGFCFIISIPQAYGCVTFFAAVLWTVTFITQTFPHFQADRPESENVNPKLIVALDVIDQVRSIDGD